MKIALVGIRTHDNKRDVHESDASRIELTQAMQTVDVSLYLYPPTVAAPGFKKWGGGQEGGNDWLWGGQTCARSAHSEREARADFFELLGSDFFWANMCAERT